MGIIAGSSARAAVVLAACAVAMSSSVAQQDRSQAEGAFTVNFTAINTSPQRPVAISKDRDMGVYTSVLTTTNAAGKGPLHNLTGRCLGWFVIDRAAGSHEQRGQCNFADADGDIVYERFDFEPQALGEVRIGTGRWTGGTGKYVGLRGEFEIRVRTLKPATEGIVQSIGTKEGRFRFSTHTQ